MEKTNKSAKSAKNDSAAVNSFNEVANDVNTAKKPNTNVLEKPKNQATESRKDSANELQTKYMSANEKIKFMLKNSTSESFKNMLNLNGLKISDISTPNLLNCFTKVTITTETAQKAFRIKLIAKTDKNLHCKKSEFLKFFVGEQESKEVVDTEIIFSVLDVNYKAVEIDGTLYFTKNDKEFTFVIVSDYSRLSFLQIMSKIAVFKSREKLYFAQQKAKAEREAQKAENLAKKQLSAELKKVSEMTIDEKIAYYTAQKEIAA